MHFASTQKQPNKNLKEGFNVNMTFEILKSLAFYLGILLGKINYDQIYKVRQRFYKRLLLDRNTILKRALE